MTSSSLPPRARSLGERAWPELAEREASPVVVLPVGSTEQHGPHLPLDTDTRIAVAVAERVAAALAERGGATLVAPAVAYGSSGEHEGFPGTVSIGRDALATLLLEYGRSASAWASRLVIVNGHGGNVEPVRDAVMRLRDEGRDAAWAPCAAAPADGLPADAHAGRAETSLLLHLAPGLVRGDAAEAGETAPLARILPGLREHGVRGVSPNGVLGDPSGASAEEGARLLDAIVHSALARLTGDVS
ncbi:mycofactocin biosynthesis peptidyl-dipeptidase MftE [Microbacterium marinilacus]|uniref:Mycofactocin biosynthesis peptidyl-dipeptidase MftE n=1 Tax=Microbacterium marinilacus TaxID=415209 RepID=A0ABP7BK88_9MICO|nr:mycofactocin biosynthesis peptidyl-dipeptidase MftE [Microbacterium marinilacus]MBY0688384.1 mycofactocin biosynthesis peptidyl-dipeptidase MftE [Microbacterium marinilacus]